MSISCDVNFASALWGTCSDASNRPPGSWEVPTTWSRTVRTSALTSEAPFHLSESDGANHDRAGGGGRPGLRCWASGETAFVALVAAALRDRWPWNELWDRGSFTLESEISWPSSRPRAGFGRQGRARVAKTMRTRSHRLADKVTDAVQVALDAQTVTLLATSQTPRVDTLTIPSLHH
jgi:hypothetical protein